MDLDDQLQRYFGTRDMGALTAGAIEAGIDRMRVDRGMEKDRGRRFALWALLHMFGAAPDLDVTFKDEADRNSARDLMEMLERGEG